MAEKSCIAVEECLRVLQELRTPLIEASTLCLGNKQMLQKNRDEYFVSLQAQVLDMQTKIEHMTEAVRRLEEKAPDRPPFRTPPPPQAPVIQPVSCSKARV